jgi:hypothetical protein
VHVVVKDTASEDRAKSYAYQGHISHTGLSEPIGILRLLSLSPRERFEDIFTIYTKAKIDEKAEE